MQRIERLQAKGCSELCCALEDGPIEVDQVKPPSVMPEVTASIARRSWSAYLPGGCSWVCCLSPRLLSWPTAMLAVILVIYAVSPWGPTLYDTEVLTPWRENAADSG